MSTSEQPSHCSQTPAGARLEAYMTSSGCKVTGADYYDRLAAVVLSVPRNTPKDAHLALVEVLKDEFTMFTAADKMWRRVAAGMLAKLEARGMILVRSGEKGAS